MDTNVSDNIQTNALFTQYMDVVNRAIGENRSGIYGKAVKLWDKTFADDEIAVGVFHDDAKHPHHWYTLKLSAGTFDIVSLDKHDKADIEWKVSDEHLAHVVDNPRKYIDHPLELQLDWLRTRVGLS